MVLIIREKMKTVELKIIERNIILWYHHAAPSGMRSPLMTSITQVYIQTYIIYNTDIKVEGRVKIDSQQGAYD